jgi:hypothetical protein
MVKLDNLIKKFLASRLAGRRMQLLQFKHLVHKVSVFVINYIILIGRVTASEHRGDKAKDVLGSPHGTDRNMRSQVLSSEEEGQHVVNLIQEVDISELGLLHAEIVSEGLMLAQEG